MTLPATQRDALVVTRRRLELKYVGWPGDWESFVASIRAEGNPFEIQVIDRFPAEFRSSAMERAQRVDAVISNRVEEMLEKLAKLTGATKTCMKTGEQVSDNATRLKATEKWLDLAMGMAASPPPPPKRKGELADEMQGIQKRKQEIHDMLASRGGQVTETTVTRTVTLAGEEEG